MTLRDQTVDPRPALALVEDPSTIVGVEVTETLCARCAERRSPLSMGEAEHLSRSAAAIRSSVCDSCGHRLSEPDQRPEHPFDA